MTVLTSAFPTLLDQAKLLDPNGNAATVVELLSMSTPILDDMHVIEGNLPGGHRSTVETSLPPSYWRSFNQGIQAGKGTTTQVDEQAGLNEAFTVIDRALADFGGNRAAYSMRRGRMQMRGMTNEVVSTLIYGNAGTSINEFTGFMPRMSSLSAGNAQNVIDGGGTGSDNASILIVKWGDGVHGYFPKGSKAGITHEDLGEKLLDSVGGVPGAMMVALVDHWIWNLGLATPDWRDMVRICNIDISNLVGNSTPADLTDLVEHGLECLTDGPGRLAIYMNRTVGRVWRKQQREDVTSGGGLTFENVGGRRVMMFDDVPIRRIDAMLSTEARVT